MAICLYEPFIGLQHLEHLNVTEPRGKITECFYDAKGIMTFVTDKGWERSYYYLDPQIELLENGDWKLYGDRPRYGIVRDVKKWAWRRLRIPTARRRNGTDR